MGHAGPQASQGNSSNGVPALISAQCSPEAMFGSQTWGPHGCQPTVMRHASYSAAVLLPVSLTLPVPTVDSLPDCYSQPI